MTRAWARLIGLYEVVGGVVALVSLGMVLPTVSWRFWIAVAHLATLVGALVSRRAGLLLHRLDSRGFALSRVIQLLQVPRVTIPALAYNFAVGPYFSADVVFADVMITLRGSIWPHALIEVGSHNAAMGLGLNLFAALLWFLLWRDQLPVDAEAVVERSKVPAA